MFKKRVQLITQSIQRMRQYITKKVIFSYFLVTIPLALLLGFLVDTILYAIDPTLLPAPIIRLASIYWTILVGLLSLLSGLAIASKRSWNYIKKSLPTRRLRIAVGIVSLLTALLYPGWQIGSSYFGPHHDAIAGTPYSGIKVVENAFNVNRFHWKAYPLRQGGCMLTDAGYEVRTTPPDNIQSCIATATDFSDFAYQIEMTLIQGGGGGIFFRDSESGTYELEALLGGYFKLYVFDRDAQLQSLTPDCSIGPTGCSIGEYLDVNQTVSIAVIARGASIEIYFDTHRV